MSHILIVFHGCLNEGQQAVDGSSRFVYVSAPVRSDGTCPGGLGYGMTANFLLDNNVLYGSHRYFRHSHTLRHESGYRGRADYFLMTLGRHYDIAVLVIGRLPCNAIT